MTTASTPSINRAEGPTLYSLASFRASIADNVRDTLRCQYQDESHFQRILDVMKLPPGQTVLRMTQPADNNDNDGRSQIHIEHLQEKIRRWLGEQRANKMIQSHVRLHPILNDVITIDLQEVNVENDDNDESSDRRNHSLYTKTIPDPERYPVVFPEASQRNDWPRTHRVVLVDRFCGEAALRGADIFVRGILAADSGIRPDESVAVYVHVQRGEKLSRGLDVSKYTGECIFLGLGRSVCSRANYFSQSHGRGVRLSALPFERAGPVLPPLDSWLSDNSLFAQNLPSVVVGHVLAPQRGDAIYDMCGAPGGKTSHIARLANFQATIVMSDKSRRKVITAKAMFRDLGCGSCVVPLHMDGTASVDEQADPPYKSVQQLISTTKSDADGLLEIDKFFPGSFDRVLLDPPCSALGLRPKLHIDQKTDKDLLAFANYQERLVGQAVRLIRSDGLLVYSTCTMHARENEGMVQYILDKHPEMKLVPITIPLGSMGLPGQGLSWEDCAKVRRFDPTLSDTIGFFIAAFTKRPVSS